MTRCFGVFDSFEAGRHQLVGKENLALESWGMKVLGQVWAHSASALKPLHEDQRSTQPALQFAENSENRLIT